MTLVSVEKIILPQPLYINQCRRLCLPVQKGFPPCGASSWMTAAIVNCYMLQAAGTVNAEWNSSGPPPPSTTSWQRLQLVKGPRCAAWETCFDTQKDPSTVVVQLRGQTHLRCHYSLLSFLKVVISVLKKWKQHSPVSRQVVQQILTKPYLLPWCVPSWTRCQHPGIH